MGLLHLLVLKAALPDALVGVVEPLEDRRELALSLGADFSRAPETASNAVAELTGGLGADAIFDTAGGSGALARAPGTSHRAQPPPRMPLTQPWAVVTRGAGGRVLALDVGTAKCGLAVRAPQPPLLHRR